MNHDLLARFLTGRTSESDSAQVMAWRKASVENERQFQAIVNLIAIADQNRKPGPPPTAAEVVAAASELERRIGGRSRKRRRSSRPTEWVKLWAFGAAAALLVLALGSAVALRLANTKDFAAQQIVTDPDEQATVLLNDGTVVRLAGGSRLLVAEGSRRNVSLVGRAYFAVARDENRPFTVRTASGDVRVLGTRFTLAASEEDLQLVVVEGRVALTAPEDDREVFVSTSQMARVVRGTRLPVVEVPDSALTANWVGDFLAFQNTPLRDAVREIARAYEVEIAIEDPTLADRTITAWFAGWSLEDVIEVVCMVASASCTLEDSIVTIKPSAASEH